MEDKKDYLLNEFDREFGDSYRESKSSATNPDHQLPGNTADESDQSLTPKAVEDSITEDAKLLAEQVKPYESDDLKVFGCAIADLVNTMYPNGPNVRHRAALKLYYDLLVLFDGNHDLARQAL